MKFHGEFDELTARLSSQSVDGPWEEKPNNCRRLKLKSGACVNWSTNKGTIWLDGPQDAKKALQEKVEAALSDAVDAVVPPKDGDATVFVVHGHDHTSREQLELVLHKLGLEPFVLQNTDGEGLTIIESLEKMIGKNAESSFGIVLLTPDDIGYAKKDGEEEAKARAQQNVVLEMGMLLASLTRPRVAILQKGFVEVPSDANGVNYLGYNDHVKEVVPKLVGRLQKAGFEIPAEKVAAASS